jgi:hypothetical protein
MQLVKGIDYAPEYRDLVAAEMPHAAPVPALPTETAQGKAAGVGDSRPANPDLPDNRPPPIHLPTPVRELQEMPAYGPPAPPSRDLPEGGYAPPQRASGQELPYAARMPEPVSNKPEPVEMPVSAESHLAEIPKWVVPAPRDHRPMEWKDRNVSAIPDPRENAALPEMPHSPAQDFPRLRPPPEGKPAPDMGDLPAPLDYAGAAPEASPSLPDTGGVGTASVLSVLEDIKDGLAGLKAKESAPLSARTSPRSFRDK